jgi:putative membrane protein
MPTSKYPSMTSLALLGAALICGACGKKDSGATDSTSMASSAPASSDSAAASSATAGTPDTAGGSAVSGPAPADPSTFSDANILAKEIAGDSAEVVLAGMAKTMATDPGVKSYAAQLVSDHSKGLKETVALATKLSISPEVPAGDTTSLSTSHMKSRLEGLTKGSAFDTVFVNHEVEDHKDDIKDAKAMLGAAKDPKVKALIEKSIPELQQHLDRAQKLAAAKK